MPRQSARRKKLYEELDQLGRDSSSLGLMIHQSIAEQFGLGPTDLKCLDLARNEENLTAGRLAELTGLSTSAVTAALDRLEQRGFIERQRDPADRRKVIVVATGTHDGELAKAYVPVSEGFAGILDDYSEEEIEVIARYTRQLNARARDLLKGLDLRRR